MLSRWRRKGRHRGVYSIPLSVTAWDTNPPAAEGGQYLLGELFRNVKVWGIGANPEDTPTVATLTFMPPEGVATIPVLETVLNEDGIRDVVRDEMAATPIYTALQFGGL